MKKTGSTSQINQRIQAIAAEMGGVFTFSDLFNVIGLASSDRTAKVLLRLAREGLLIKVRRGIYATRSPDLWVLASRLKAQACISMDSVLAKNGLIGTLPAKSVSLIYPGNTQTMVTPAGRFRFFKIKRELLFATQKLDNGIIAADNEKAFLDMLYYHIKGAKFVVDPRTDVDLWKLDIKKIKKYLKIYRNPKFIKFVEGILREQLGRTAGAPAKSPGR